MAAALDKANYMALNLKNETVVKKPGQ